MANKPLHALAVSYDLKRRNSKRKKMAEGGILGDLTKKVKESFSEPKPVRAGDPGYVNRDLDPKKTAAFIKGFEGRAHGGMIGDKKMKQVNISRPRMVESSVIKASLLDDVMQAPKAVEAAPKVEHKQTIDEAIEEKLQEKNELVQEMAKGGEVESVETEDEKHNSVAAAIMAKRKKLAEADSIDNQDSMDLSDSTSLLEEVAETEEELSEGTKHDRISAIRARMKKLR